MNSLLLKTQNFAEETARFILNEAEKSIAARGLFRLALSGGNTPRIVHEALSDLGKALHWERVQITFGDERCVPPEDPDSNYRMAKESLLDRVPIPAGNVFRIRGEIDPATAAAEYESKLAAVASRFGETRYVHDLILLGMGPDGHTASLFPGSPALDEKERSILPVIGPKPPPQRITFTFPLINCARHVAFLVNGRDKLGLVEEIRSGLSELPAARVQPTPGDLTWMLGEG